VYRALGPSGPVAVKLLGSASDLDDAAGARFRREVAALGQLAHPHLVAMLDHGVDDELGPYLVLPLLAGATLRALCGGRALCPEAALLLAQPIAHACAALHAAGFVHRDLKPENVIAGPDGAVTVIDLGLAWREGMTRHTETGAAVGSVGYMAPEQIEARPVDGRADVWALGVMLHEWIAGTRPFARARPAEEAAAMLLGVHPRLTSADRRCDDALADLVARCLELDPSRRPSADELAREIDALIDWTVTPDVERAAVIADPDGYQARVARFRVRRVEHQARTALAAGQPFVALALCDRGLAYVPEHPPILELVAAAEAATRREPAPASSEAAPRPVRRGPYLAATALAFVAGSVLTYLLVPDRPAPARSTAAPALADDAHLRELERRERALDRELLGGFVSTLGKVADVVATQRPAASEPGVKPTTASGWLALSRTQEPADAVRSLREALALSPGWSDAQIALCAALAATRDAGAVPACDAALRLRPGAVEALAARGRARLDAGDARGALADLDRVVRVDPDPRWRLLRARARSALGDRDGARTDRETACQLGHAEACADTP